MLPVNLSPAVKPRRFVKIDAAIIEPWQVALNVSILAKSSSRLRQRLCLGHPTANFQAMAAPESTTSHSHPPFAFLIFLWSGCLFS
jgi:hypothetical protein